MIVTMNELNEFNQNIELDPAASGEGREEILLPELLRVSPAPHIKSLDSTRSIMLDVMIALLPALIWGVWQFGWRALSIVLISVAAAVAGEAVFQLITRRRVTVTDFSAVVTGLILGLSLPARVSFWIPAVGAVFAIVIGKQLFGGIGKNIVNPALAGRVFLMLCWPEEMNRAALSADVTSCATPLVSLKDHLVPGTAIYDLVLGNAAGAIGEVSALALAAGFVYLLVRRVVSWQIPVAFIGVSAILFFLFPLLEGQAMESMTFGLCSGSLLFCAFFAANDFTTIPVTGKGRLVFGVGCALITVAIRYFGSYPEGAAFAILIMNLLVPYIERFTAPVRFGKKFESKENENA